MAKEEKNVTVQELQYNDGREGKRTLVAFEGSVYDLTESKLWPGGNHMNRHRAGQDLTEALSAAPHGPEMLERFNRTGKLLKEEAGISPPSRLTRRFLALHPHPVSVHFPIAFTVATSLFVILYFATGHQPFEATSLYMMILACLMTPAAMATGWVSWWLAYGHKPTPTFKAKMALSVVLEILLVAGVLIRLSHPTILTSPLGTGGVLHAALTLILAPMVVALGYLGGRITFPR